MPCHVLAVMNSKANRGFCQRGFAAHRRRGVALDCSESLTKIFRDKLRRRARTHTEGAAGVDADSHRPHAWFSTATDSSGCIARDAARRKKKKAPVKFPAPVLSVSSSSSGQREVIGGDRFISRPAAQTRPRPVRIQAAHLDRRRRGPNPAQHLRERCTFG